MPQKLAQGRFEIKDADKGTFVALFARFNVVDKDGDVTYPGAFPEGKSVPVSTYNHSSMLEGKLPGGSATIKQTASEGQAHGRFWLDTKHGEDAWRTLKNQQKDGIPSEWSYGYDPTDYSFGEHDNQPVRFLKTVDVYEVSPVIRGAGVDTHTIEIKGNKPGQGEPARGGYSGALRPHETDTVDTAWRPSDLLKSLGVGPSVPDLRYVHAMVDTAGDPERQTSYRFAHHDGPGGPANMRACLLAIAALNGGKASGISDSAKAAVYEHLASHLRDAGREPPALRGPDGALKLNDHAMVVLADLQELIARFAEVGASRALKGRTLTGNNLEVLSWINEEMTALRSMLDSPQETVAHEFARFVALSQNIGG